MDWTGVALVVPLGAVALYAFLVNLHRRNFSALYWLSTIAVFVAPAATDILFGLPALAHYGVFRVYNPDAKAGIHPATLFALGHVVVTVGSYTLFSRWLSRRSGGWKRQASAVVGTFRVHWSEGFRARPRIRRGMMVSTSGVMPMGGASVPVPNNRALAVNIRQARKDQRFVEWMKTSNALLGVLAMCFLLSALVVVLNRSDLTRQFNDFLEQGSKPAYETYFLLACSPLMAILLERGRPSRSKCWLLAIASVVVAYFIGVRYYMFPFVGYLVWMKSVHAKGTLRRKVGVLLLVTASAWLTLTVWGIIRSLGIRATPLEIFQVDDPTLVKETVVAGNELAARLAYYDLMIRLDRDPQFQGLAVLKATALSVPYPMLTRLFGIEPPLSNSKLVYELQSRTMGTGVSTGTTVFGNEWFTWGWWGMLVGGLHMGFLLSLTDRLHRVRNAWWLLLGPMATFQLIFFARGGTDVWLGLWGRFLPLTFSMVLLAFVYDRIKGDIWSLGQGSASWGRVNVR